MKAIKEDGGFSEFADEAWRLIQFSLAGMYDQLERKGYCAREIDYMIGYASSDECSARYLKRGLKEMGLKKK